MSIRLKLFLLLVLISIVPLVSAEQLGFGQIKIYLRSQIIEQLRFVANTQEERLNEIRDSYVQEARSIASNTFLQNSFSREPQVARLPTDTILREYTDQRDDLVNAAVYAENGRRIAIAYSEHSIPNRHLPTVIQSVPEATLGTVFADNDGSVLVDVLGPIRYDNERVGTLLLFFSGDRLTATNNLFSEFGSTAEILLAKKDERGNVFLITPARFQEAATAPEALLQNPNAPIISAINNIETTFNERNAKDYREVPVFAVTKYVESLGIGLVVKIDQEEALRATNRLSLINIAIMAAVAVLIIIFSNLYATRFTRPILALVDATNKFSQGDLSKRVKIKNKDEVGRLANAFNHMASALQIQYQKLEKIVEERTKQLRENVKELRASNARNTAVIESIGDGLVLTDALGNITYINEQTEHLLGWTQGELIGKPLVQQFKLFEEGEVPVADKDRPATHVLTKGEKTQTLISSSKYYQKKDGTLLPIALTATPVRVQDELIGMVEVFRDVTEDKLIDQAKTEFVSLASHQLRTPLSIINWYAELLLDGKMSKLDEEQEGQVKEIYDGSQRLVGLVNALLNVSRIDLGTFSVQPEKVQFMEFVRGIIHDLGPYAIKKRIDLKGSIPKEEMDLLVDPQLMRIVIENLVTNAIKYTPEEGSVEIAVTVQKDDVLVSVKDTGLGIPEDQKEKIFTKLFRARNVRNMAQEGTGLGLYVAQSIIQHSGGKIWFESEENKGSTFFVTLPLAGMKPKEGTKTIDLNSKPYAK